MTIAITPSGQACGARVTGVDLTRPLAPENIADISAAWLDHHVLAFPDQRMSDDDLERFTGYFGGFGDDPFIDRKRVVEGKRVSVSVDFGGRRIIQHKKKIITSNTHNKQT